MNHDENHIKRIADWLGAGSINIFGVQFAGKDTQARELADMLGGFVLSGGDILRGSKNQGLIQHINTGSLAPTDEYLRTVLPFLKQEKFAGKPLILSSVGRLHGEEPSVMEATAAADHPIRAVILLNLSEEKTWERWRAAQSLKDRGDRADEDAEALKRRLSEFYEKTLPVIDFYRANNLLIEVNGDASKDEVTTDILNRLSERANGD